MYWRIKRGGCLQGAGCPPMGRKRVCLQGGCGLPTEGGGLPTVGGQTHPKPEKWAVRILLECFLVRMNIIIKVHLHWTKQKLTRKRIVFFDLCCYSMWTLHWILYEPILTRFPPLCNPQFETHLTTSWKYLNCWITALLQKDIVTWFCNEQIPRNLLFPTTRWWSRF